MTDASSGEPLPFASIFVQETRKGAVTNENGRYRIDLSGGDKTLVIQYLGYQKKVQRVNAGRGSLDIALEPEALDLGEVEVISGGEDLSYSVIRRAIAKANYHRNQFDSYSADVYLKTTGRIKKIPGIVKALASKEDREEIDDAIARDFTGESFNRIEYERPNTFRQDVVRKLEFGDLDFDPGPYVFSSFYQPEIAETVSPLSPKAFGYYRFEHEGVSVSGDELINKIRVIPRSRGEGVFSGYVYIVQDDWSLHSLDLTTYKTGIEVNITQTFNEIIDRAWLPMTTRIEAEGSILGLEFEGRYVAATSNYEVELNPDLGGYVEVIDEKTQPERAAQVGKRRDPAALETTLAEGGELTRKDLRKLLRSYEKEERREQDEPEVVGNYTFNNDSVQTTRDTAAWAALRPIPLTESERTGYVLSDSLKQVAVADSVRAAENAVSGDTRNKSGRPKWLRPFDVAPVYGFNPVQGHHGGAALTANIHRPATDDRKRRQLAQLVATADYGFSWNRLNWETELFLGRRSGTNGTVIGGTENETRGGLALRGGRTLRQFDPSGAILPEINTLWALLGGENYLRLYERAFGEATYRKRFSDAFALTAALRYEDRRAVRNTTNRRLFGNDDEFRYDPNAPINLEVGSVTEVNDAALLELGVTYRPGLKYFIRNGQREISRDSRSQPTLGLDYRAGLPDIGNSVANFHHLRASYEQRFDVGQRGEVSLLLRGGAFLSDEFVDFPDFRHFATSEIFLTSLDPIGSYRLLPYYALSTAGECVEFYGHYQFRKFLLSRIWKLHLAGLREDLFVNYLQTPVAEHYVELGYSIDNILRILRLEFVTSFRDGTYEDFGVRLSVTTDFLNQ